MPLNLPPLNALRAFEAAARTGSYVSAALELHVSPAAVSQHVRNLEEYLGKKLFSRHNNRVVLTDAGRAVQSGISEPLLSISTLTEQVKSGTTRSRLSAGWSQDWSLIPCGTIRCALTFELKTIPLT